MACTSRTSTPPSSSANYYIIGAIAVLAAVLVVLGYSLSHGRKAKPRK